MLGHNMTRWAALGLAALATMAAPTDATAKCALRMLDDEVVTNAADAIPAGGGVLVGWTESDDRTGARDVDPAVHPAWSFREKRKKVRATMTTIAPGLVVYVPAVARGQKHTVALVDDTGAPVGTYTIARAAAVALPAPEIDRVARSDVQSFRSNTIALTAALKARAAIPAGAYGLVLYRGDVALSWHRIDKPDATEVLAFRSPGRCGTQPPAMAPAAAGDTVTLAWVDRFGRVSARSAPITVK